MSSSWLKDYMLEGLGSEIRKASSNDTTSATKTGRKKGRLVKILDRGQVQNHNSGRASRGNDWWNLKRRGKSPNLAKYTSAWILVSDGSHSARIYFTVQALKEIFDWDSQNNNQDTMFVRDCCILLKNYSFGCNFDEENYEHHNAKDKDSSQDLVHLKVSSLEPKPGFNHEANADSGETTIRPVTEENDVLYGLRCIARQRQHPMSAAMIARDWDIAFGRLSKGRLTLSEEETLVGGQGGLEKILEMAEEAASKDAAIQQWELAKKDFGVVDTEVMGNGEKNAPTSIAKGRKNDHDDDQEHGSQEEEDLSHMYIQNVLATQNDEEESESQNQETNEDENMGSDNEDAELFETQPKIIMAATKPNTQPIGKEEKVKKSKRPRASSFESASNLTLDEAFSRPVNARKSLNQKRRRQDQRVRQQQQQEKSHKSNGIWESVKEQLFQPGRTLVHCVPVSRLPVDDPSKDDENTFVTPKRPFISSVGSAKNLGSGASVGTNFTSSTPNPSSGAYYRKYGLSRWLSQNTIDDR